VIDRQRTPDRELAVGNLAELDRFSLYDLVWDEDPLPYSDHLHRDFLAQFPDDDVRQALLALPEVYRVPLVLLHVEDLSYRELADILGCPVGTVMSRLHRPARSWNAIYGSQNGVARPSREAFSIERGSAQRARDVGGGHDDNQHTA
jgi:DNA-directed RNA polymerase specialized sigma24 family protein